MEDQFFSAEATEDGTVVVLGAKSLWIYKIREKATLVETGATCYNMSVLRSLSLDASPFSCGASLYLAGSANSTVCILKWICFERLFYFKAALDKVVSSRISF
jgi:hypothetical protein